jgi:hypothetical protein
MNPARVAGIIAAAVVAAVVLLCACFVGTAFLMQEKTAPPYSEFYVDNQTDHPIIVAAPGGTSGFNAVPAPPHAVSTLPFARPCTDSNPVATTESGTEIARLGRPACDKQRWVFAADGTTRLELVPDPANPASSSPLPTST